MDVQCQCTFSWNIISVSTKAANKRDLTLERFGQGMGQTPFQGWKEFRQCNYIPQGNKANPEQSRTHLAGLT